MTDPIVKTITVPGTPAHAFDVFVNRIAKWWPLDGHAASAAAGKAALAVVIEPHVGGAVYEVMWDGGRDEWGEVLQYEEGVRFAMTWHPGNNKDHPTQVAVAFDSIEGEQTQVTLTHSGWENWADKADEMHGTYNTGWDFVLGQCYVAIFTEA